MFGLFKRKALPTKDQLSYEQKVELIPQELTLNQVMEFERYIDQYFRLKNEYDKVQAQAGVPIKYVLAAHLSYGLSLQLPANFSSPWEKLLQVVKSTNTSSTKQFIESLDSDLIWNGTHFADNIRMGIGVYLFLREVEKDETIMEAPRRNNQKGTNKP